LTILFVVISLGQTVRPIHRYGEIFWTSIYAASLMNIVPTLTNQTQSRRLITERTVSDTLHTSTASWNHINRASAYTFVLMKIPTRYASIAVAVIKAGQTLHGAVNAHIDAGELPRRAFLALTVKKGSFVAGKALSGITSQAIESIRH
jgi:hypothetical protein